MIAYKLKNLLQYKNVVFFIICYSIRSQFIREAATEISSSKYMWNRTCLIEYFSMTASYTLKWEQTFGNGVKTICYKQLIKFPFIPSTVKHASIGRSSHPDVFCKKGVLRNYAKFIGK